MSQERLIWFKGKILPADQALVPVLSPTAQFGLNVFEGIRGYWNTSTQELNLFRLADHLKRLFASCRLIGITSPYNAEDITSAIIDILQANDYREDTALRVTLFVYGEGSWSSSEPVNMFIAPIARPRRDLHQITCQRAMTSTWERIDDRAFPPRVKAGANYINGRYAHLEALAAGYDLPILLDRQGRLSEGAGSCVMLVRDGVLLTPPTTGSILESITRDTLLQLAQEKKIEAEVRPVDRTELYLADEIFLCGSAAELTPISSLDRYTIGRGKVGPITQCLLQEYLHIADGTNIARASWRFPVWEA